MPPKVLIADKLSPAAVDVFKSYGLDVDVKTGLDKDQLAAIIDQYDGLAVRSATKVNAGIINAAKNLKVIGRAGIGVDTIDVPEATKRGIVVMNTPFGNSTTTAEHAIALMFALARQIPEANASTHAGKWEKSRFMGIEVTGKTLGIIGCGNIGSIVASRAIGLKMKVIAFDPFLSIDRAKELGVEKVELNDLLARSDFITLHTPLTEKTKNVLSRENLAKTKKGVRLVNCARGGLVDEVALKELLDSGHIAGAALDVFDVEPAHEHPLFNSPNVVCTPHLGAATQEAQEIVALQVAEQMSDFLLNGAVSNAVNMPSITAEEAPRLKPYIKLAELLGAFAGQVTEGAISEVEIIYDGTLSEMNTRPLSAATVAGLLRPMMSDVNMVNGPVVLKDKGILLSEVRRTRTGAYEGMIILNIKGEKPLTIAGTALSDGKPRLIQLNKVTLDAEFAPNMFFTINSDKPGYIGALGGILGNAQINIANFNLGRAEIGGEALALVHVDQNVTSDLVEKVKALPQVIYAKSLSFDL
jgi:D-3-phosphoglycerate dehydrogenase / 2-oxoglutarate reductase